VRREDVVELEEMNFNAWPALRNVELDGWLLRYAGGDSRRVNSVNILRAGVLPLASKIEQAEAAYRRWGRRCVFRLTPLADPEIEPKLIARGYVSEAPTFVQIAPTPSVARPVGVELSDRASESWIEAALLVRGMNGEAADVFRAQHRAVRVAGTWALAREGDEALACGCSVAERGWSGLLGIYVRKDARRRGLARKVTEALLNWGRAYGAERTWLQVEQGNRAALPLYTALGFRTAYEYHHWVQPN
jgi:ribosomal protein S18 acetylase RimI-like enzyme